MYGLLANLKQENMNKIYRTDINYIDTVRAVTLARYMLCGESCQCNQSLRRQ